MFLVDDDEAQIGDWGKQRAARADHHVRLALAHEVPLVEALPHRQARMQHGDIVAETRAEAPDRLRRQRNLGDEHDGALAAFERIRDRPQVHFGLSRAGDAVHDDDVAVRRIAPRNRRVHGFECACLPLGELVELDVWAPGLLHGKADAPSAFQAHDAALLERLERRVDGPELDGELGDAHAAFCEGIQHRALLGGRLCGNELRGGIGREHPAVVDGTDPRMDELPLPVDALDLGGASGGREQVQRAGERAEVLARDPPDELDGGRVEIRGREHACEGLDLCWVASVSDDVVF